jgi:hypothetical protein
MELLLHYLSRYSKVMEGWDPLPLGTNHLSLNCLPVEQPRHQSIASLVVAHHLRDSSSLLTPQPGWFSQLGYRICFETTVGIEWLHLWGFSLRRVSAEEVQQLCYLFLATRPRVFAGVSS